MSDIHRTYVSAINKMITDGVAIIDVDINGIRAQQYRYKQFVEQRNLMADHADWTYSVPGEHEPDVGLIPPREGKDEKYYFHENHFLRQKLAGKQQMFIDRAFLTHNQAIYDSVVALAGDLTKALDSMFPGNNLYELFLRSLTESLPYSITSLRSLYYPASLGQSGAKRHTDKSLFTIHFGDVGGNLIVYQGPDDHIGQVLHIPEGKAAVFFGVKILAVDKSIEPLWHGSKVSSPSEYRMAMPFFVQIPLRDYVVTSSKEAYPVLKNNNQAFL